MSTIKKLIILTTIAAVFISSHYTIAQEYIPEESGYLEFRNSPAAGTVMALTAIGIATAIAIALRHRSNHGHGHGHSH